MILRSVVLLALLSLACGGTDSTESTADTTSDTTAGSEQPGHGHHHGHDHGHHDHGTLPPAVDAFHEAFAAQWHGDRTAASVCPNAPDLQDAAEAAVAEQQEAHPEISARVSQTADSFVAACQAEPEGGAAFDAAFSTFHDALHAMMDAARAPE